MKLLEPLSEAIEMLCASKYLTLNTALPIYVVLIQHLDSVPRGLYNQFQLIRLAEQMINKIDHYLKEAIKKPI